MVRWTRLIVTSHAHCLPSYLECWKQNYEMEQCRQVTTYHKLTATPSLGAFRGAADKVTHARGSSLQLYTYTGRFPRTPSTYTDTSFQHVTITSFPHILISSSTRMHLQSFPQKKLCRYRKQVPARSHDAYLPPKDSTNTETSVQL